MGEAYFLTHSSVSALRREGLSSRSITKVTISPRFHGEIDSSRECGLEGFSCDFSCPMLLPLRAGQG